MILLVDNYDSFSYNLYQMIGMLQPDIRVVRNDAVDVEEIEAMQPTHIIFSPGPGRPEDAGVTMEAVRRLGEKIPMLGVCLGHQAICAAFGATVTYAKRLMHGKQSTAVLDTDCALFRDCPRETLVARYHSLAVDEATLPKTLRVIARTKADGKDTREQEDGKAARMKSSERGAREQEDGKTARMKTSERGAREQEDGKTARMKTSERDAQEQKADSKTGGEVMAVRHTVYPVYGVQFHPESILTPCGRQMLENFFNETTGKVG